MQSELIQRHGAVAIGVGFALLVVIAGFAMCSADPMRPGVLDPLGKQNTVSSGLWTPTSSPQRLPAMLQQLPITLSPQLWEPAAGRQVVFLRPAPDVTVGAVSPHSSRGQCLRCHKINTKTRVAGGRTGTRRHKINTKTRVAGGRTGTRLVWTARPDTQTARGRLLRGTTTRRPTQGRQHSLPWQEAHWQGIETTPLTRAVARMLKIPSSARGVVIDDVSQPADTAGFQAGDLIMVVGTVRTPDLKSFVDATEQVRDRREAQVEVLRRGKRLRLRLVAMRKRLGTAMPETAPMIRSASIAPHPYLGACTSCHRIGTTGQLKADPGDLINRAAPTIRRGQRSPHRMRGKCSTCHDIR